MNDFSFAVSGGAANRGAVENRAAISDRIPSRMDAANACGAENLAGGDWVAFVIGI